MLETIDPYKATFAQALDVAACIVQAFMDDIGFTVGIKPRYIIHSPFQLSLGIRDPRERLDELVEKSKNYRRLIYGTAYALYPMLIDPAYKSYLFREDDTVVGTAIWHLACYSRPTVSFAWKAWSLAVGLWNYAKLIWIFLGEKRPLFTPEMQTVFRKARDHYGVGPNAATVRSYAHLSYDQLEKTRYVADACHYCNIFCTTIQGQGYGTQYMGAVLESLPAGDATFKDGDVTSEGPCKLMLLASDEGKGLYAKFGFVAAEPYTQEVDGMPYTNTLMTRDFV